MIITLLFKENEWRRSKSIIFDDDYPMRASRCHQCNRLTFIIGGKNKSWVDGCHHNADITSYMLVESWQD